MPAKDTAFAGGKKPRASTTTTSTGKVERRRVPTSAATTGGTGTYGESDIVDLNAKLKIASDSLTAVDDRNRILEEKLTEVEKLTETQLEINLKLNLFMRQIEKHVWDTNQAYSLLPKTKNMMHQ